MSHDRELRIGPWWFTPGVNGINLSTMLFAAFGTMMMVSFMNSMQPYVMTEILHIPQDEQGSLTGNLQTFQEIFFIALAGFAGVVSEKIGRPPVYAAGFVVAAAGYAIYPMADTVLQLYLIRGFYAVGATGVAIMLSTCIVDYIQERSRGRWIGVTSLFNGLGILAMSLGLTRLPTLYSDSGLDPVLAGRYAFWTVSAMCLLIGAILYFGLYRAATRQRKTDSFLHQMSQGVALGIANPRLAIAYCGAFIGRGDFNVVGTFFWLWLTQEGLDRGMTAGEALAKAGPLFGLIQFCAMLWAPVMGFITDRLNRLTATSLGLLIAGAGYIAMSQVPDPFGPLMFPAAILLGMGETSVIVSVGALLGQEASARYRGSIVGLFGQIGGIGILATAFIGGYLFDGVGRTAPFLMMGILNLILMAAALYVRSTNGEPVPQKI
jgi:MFS family permease